MYAQMIKTGSNGIKPREQMSEEERALQDKIDNAMPKVPGGAASSSFL